MFAGAKPSAGRRGLALGAALALVVVAVVVGGGSYFFFARLRPSAPAQPPVTTPSPDAVAALARVRDLEEQLARLEREKAELQAAAGGGDEVTSDSLPVGTPEPTSPEPDAAAQARAEARSRARAERARREEQARLLEEEIAAAQGRLEAEQASSSSSVDPERAPPTPEVVPPTPEPVPPTPEPVPPTPEPVPPEPTPPPVLPGQLVSLDDPDVTGPRLLDEGPPVLYPAAARNLRRSALVLVEALVGEDGSVVEATAVESSVAGMGFEAAAERRVLGHRYRPATKSGVPVRVRIRVPLQFTP